MEFLISAVTDCGICKKTNQDSVAIMTAQCKNGNAAFAVLCDGMGGLSSGEVASASVVNAFVNWFKADFAQLNGSNSDMDFAIKEVWTNLVNTMNCKIKKYGHEKNIKLGTTLTVILIINKRFFCMNVGDSRAYKITSYLQQITEDQTVVANEVKYGKITPQQAQNDPRRSILLQCIGSSENVNPDMFFGDVSGNDVFMLCSDGFRHEISKQEIFDFLNPKAVADKNNAILNSKKLIELNKNRSEKDNITVALIKVI